MAEIITIGKNEQQAIRATGAEMTEVIELVNGKYFDGNMWVEFDRIIKEYGIDTVLAFINKWNRP